LSSLRELQKIVFPQYLNQVLWKDGKGIMPVTVNIVRSKDAQITRLLTGVKLTQFVSENFRYGRACFWRRCFKVVKANKTVLIHPCGFAIGTSDKTPRRQSIGFNANIGLNIYKECK